MNLPDPHPAYDTKHRTPEIMSLRRAIWARIVDVVGIYLRLEVFENGLLIGFGNHASCIMNDSDSNSSPCTPGCKLTGKRWEAIGSFLLVGVQLSRKHLLSNRRLGAEPPEGYLVRIEEL